MTPPTMLPVLELLFDPDWPWRLAGMASTEVCVVMRPLPSIVVRRYVENCVTVVTPSTDEGTTTGTTLVGDALGTVLTGVVGVGAGVLGVAVGVGEGGGVVPG